MKPLYKKTIKLSVALLLILILIFFSNTQQLVDSLKEVTLSEMVFLLLLSFIMIALSAYKWQFFMQALGAKINFLKLCQFYLVGYFINMFVPSYVGGDALRSYYAGKTAGQHQALSATLLERGTGFVAMLFLAIIAALIRSDLIGLAVGKFVIIFSLAVLSSFAVLIFAGKHLCLKFFNFLIELSFVQNITIFKKICVQCVKLFDVLFSLRVDLKGWLIICLLSVAFHTLTVINTYYAGIVVGWGNPPIADLFVVLPIILIIGAIPLTPAGLGIQEGAFFHYLQLLGASSGQAMAVALVLRAKTLILAFLGWLIWIKLGSEIEKTSNVAKS